MKFKEIYEEFNSKVTADVACYRPCDPLFGVPYIFDSIVIWLNGGGRLIYTHEDSGLKEKLIKEAEWLENSMSERVEYSDDRQRLKELASLINDLIMIDK